MDASGEQVFSSPGGFALLSFEELHDLNVWEKFRFAADAEGALPGWRYVIRKKGKVEIASTLCETCHTRVIDGQTVPGAPATSLLGAQAAYFERRELNAATNRSAAERGMIARQFSLFSAPWVDPDPAANITSMTASQVLTAYDAHSSGVAALEGTNLFLPPRIPDLSGIKDRRYLGATGSHRHLDQADLMRYAALHSGFDLYTQYGDYRPSGALPDPATLSRLSDAQLYALAVYLYRLKPPVNPNRPDTMSKRGQKIFDREGCPTCHPAPLYTTGKPQPAGIPADSRTSTGNMQAPSLKNIWYREPVLHDGSLAMLEDLFDVMRIRDNYVPTGSKGYGVETRPVTAHPFGLKLSFDERRALTAFLRTL